jgi:hypothetical protein
LLAQYSASLGKTCSWSALRSATRSSKVELTKTRNVLLVEAAWAATRSCLPVAGGEGHDRERIEPQPRATPGVRTGQLATELGSVHVDPLATPRTADTGANVFAKSSEREDLVSFVLGLRTVSVGVLRIDTGVKTVAGTMPVVTTQAIRWYPTSWANRVAPFADEVTALAARCGPDARTPAARLVARQDVFDVFGDKTTSVLDRFAATTV